VKAILDVGYRGDSAVTACIHFREWGDPRPSAVTLSRRRHVAPYVPGRFFERELPCLLQALNEADTRFDVLVIDGFVHLQPPLARGLGAHLAATVPGPAAVVGVAKRSLRVADRFVPVWRGRSRKPLFVSAIGMPVAEAAALVVRMHGPHRLPTLIRLADRLSRS
jgi:deoxyribonuclease V